MMGAAPYRIETRRVVLRCAGPEDAPQLLETENASRPELPGGMITDVLVFTLLVRDYAASPAKQTEVAAFDALGRRVL